MSQIRENQTGNTKQYWGYYKMPSNLQTFGNGMKKRKTKSKLFPNDVKITNN